MSELFNKVDELTKTAPNVLEGLNLQREFMSEVSTEVHNMLSGDQVISFLQSLAIPESEIDKARLLVVRDKTYRNSDAFFEAVKLGIDNSPINIESIGNGVKLLNTLNKAIEEVAMQMFTKLNESEDENRFHKAICLRRDIKRMGLIASRFVGMESGVNIDWSVIDVKEDYIDGAVDFSFLDEPTKLYITCGETEPKDWWEALGNISDLISQIKYRIQFIERLKVFNIE